MRNFPLQGFNRHLHWFRCSGKREHLNLAARQNQAANQLTTNVLQDFRQLCPWFRCQHGLERSGMQMCPGGASGGGSTKRAAEQPGASEPERNSKNHCNTLKNFPLHGSIKNLYRFRCQQGLERSGMQMCPGGASGGGFHKTCSRTARGI